MKDVSKTGLEMKDSRDYKYNVLRYKYTILRRLIQRRCHLGKRPRIKSLQELEKISYELEGKNLMELRSLHQAYLY